MFMIKIISYALSIMEEELYYVRLRYKGHFVWSKWPANLEEAIQKGIYFISTYYINCLDPCALIKDRKYIILT